MNNLKLVKVYNYKNGKKQDSVRRYLVCRLNGMYLCTVSGRDYDIMHKFKTEWYDFMENN